MRGLSPLLIDVWGQSPIKTHHPKNLPPPAHGKELGKRTGLGQRSGVAISHPSDYLGRRVCW